MIMLENIKAIVLILALFVLVITIILSFMRSVIGPRTSDRVVGVNMVGTRVIMMIAILAIYLKEDGIIDVDIIYALLSFLAVIVLCKVYVTNYEQHKGGKE